MLFGLALPALGLAFGRARAALSGPAAGAIAATGVAIVVVGGLALGLMWLRGDARRDAEAVCRGDRLAVELQAANARNAAVAAALVESQNELQLRSVQTQQLAADSAEQRALTERLRDDMAKLETAAGAAAAACLPDDGWLRRERTKATAAGPGRRSGAAPVPADR
jgi:hypothetical protein